MKAKKILVTLGFTMAYTMSVVAQSIVVSTPNNSLVLSANTGEELKFVYYGAKVSGQDVSALTETDKPAFAAYPVYGLNCPAETTLAVQHTDGNMSLQMVVDKVETYEKEQAEWTVVSLKDKVYPFSVKVYYKAWQDADVIETWTEISHGEKKEVLRKNFL